MRRENVNIYTASIKVPLANTRQSNPSHTHRVVRISESEPWGGCQQPAFTSLHYTLNHFQGNQSQLLKTYGNCCKIHVKRGSLGHLDICLTIHMSFFVRRALAAFSALHFQCQLYLSVNGLHIQQVKIFVAKKNISMRKLKRKSNAGGGGGPLCVSAHMYACKWGPGGVLWGTWV